MKEAVKTIKIIIIYHSILVRIQILYNDLYNDLIPIITQQCNTIEETESI